MLMAQTLIDGSHIISRDDRARDRGEVIQRGRSIIHNVRRRAGRAMEQRFEVRELESGKTREPGAKV